MPNKFKHINCRLSDKSYEGPRKSNRKSNDDLKSLQPMSLQNKQRAKSGDNRNRLTNRYG